MSVLDAGDAEAFAAGGMRGLGEPTPASVLRQGGAAGPRSAGGVSGRIRAMIKAIFNKPLRLQIGEYSVSFNSLADFEFSLVGRTEVPVAKLVKLMTLDPQELKREAKSIREAETRFAETLSRTVEVPGSIGDLMRGLSLQLFSQDHHWRSIIEALAQQGAQYDEYKRVALVRYMQYLAARQEVLKALYQHRTAAVRQPGIDTADPMSAAQARETAIFDLNQLPEAQQKAAAMRRLPRGETVSLRLAEGEQMELLLARHRFKLVRGTKEYFVIDDAGASHRLKAGANTVGRQEGNEVPVDPAHGSVSRRHLIIEVTPDLGIHLTDLSAHGTSVPAGRLGPDSSEQGA